MWMDTKAGKFVRRGAASGAIATLLASAVSAQSASTPGADAGATPPAELATIEVLGSHIRRVDIENQHPIFTIDRAQILRTGLSSVSDILQEVVFNGETLNRQINNGGNGEMLVNLRSLGFNRTLVLFNGQRFVTDIGGAVDLSAIPLSIVDHIEVLIDSASAIYGSDAIAGVVNIVTRRDFDGGEFSAYYGQTDHADGRHNEYELAWGHKGDGWSAVVGVEYSHDDPVYAGDRTISAVPRYGLPTGAAGSSFAPYTTLVPESLLFAYYTRKSFGLRLKEGAQGNSPDDFRPIERATDRFNYAPFNYLQTPQQRRSLFAQTRYEFSPSLALNADVLVTQRQSDQRLAPPTVAFDSGDSGQGAFGIAADNVYNPFGEPIALGVRRFAESGPRIFQQTADTDRVHAGLDGSFMLAGRNFAWSVDAIATRVRVHEFTGTYADNRRLAPALGPSYYDSAGVAHCGQPDAPIPGCVPLNLFGPPGSITREMLDYVNAGEVNRTSNDSRVADAHVTSNDLFALPAGDVAFAAGISHRRESGDHVADPLRASGNENGNGVTYDSTSGSYSVDEAYIELDSPLLADKPFAQKLDFVIGTRYSRYTNFGATTNAQFGLRWRPVDDLLVRANRAQGFRAPAVTELFQGTIRSADPELVDPCDAAFPLTDSPPTAATLTRCAQLGVPSDVNSLAQKGNRLQGGNSDLQPETSRSSGVGAVYAPQWISGLDLSLDWYDIQVRRSIGDPGAQSIIDDCYIRNSDAACAYIVRDANDGTLFQVTDLIQNSRGGIETEGYDFTVNWRHDTAHGRISAHWVTNYVDYFGEIGQPRQGSSLADGSIAVGNVVGLNSPNYAVSSLFGVIWRWRSQLQLAWQNDTWSASITGRFFDHIVEDCSVPFQVARAARDPGLVNVCSDPTQSVSIGGVDVPKNYVPSVTLTDIAVGWKAPWNADISVGVRNVFDRTPPVSYSAFSNSFFPDYDIPGRFIYARYRQRF